MELVEVRPGVWKDAAGGLVSEPESITTSARSAHCWASFAELMKLGRAFGIRDSDP